MTIDEHTKQATAFYDPYKKKELDSANQVYDEQEKVLNDSYNTQIADVKKSYVDVERENAIQKLINEREIEENMANMGLSNSGLNRTQQTAVQLSYANNQNKISLQRQAEVDSLAQSLAQEISTIKQNRIASESDINSKYSSLISEMATTNYNNELKEETERRKAYYDAQVKLQEQRTKQAEQAAKQEKENSYIIKANGGALAYGYQGKLQDHNVTVTDNGNGTITYTDKNSKKQTTIPKKTNPYTLDDNTALIKEYGAFDNGYQYKGKAGVGAFTKTANGNVKSEGTIHLFGEGEINRSQNVFSTNVGGKRYWTWYGGANDYVEVEKTESGWKIK